MSSLASEATTPRPSVPSESPDPSSGPRPLRGVRAWLVVALVGAVAVACEPSDSNEVKYEGTEDGGGDGSGGDGGTDDGSGSATDGGDDGTTDPPDPESECDDGTDNDEDGLVDCEDPDCAEVTPCWWPEAIAHEGAFDFDGRTVECDFGIGSIDVDVDDCVTAYSATLTPVTDPSLECPTCDRTFYSTLSYSVNTCEDVLEGGSYPADAYFGFIFTSETEWRLVGKDDAGNWEAGVDLIVEGDAFTFSTTEALNIDSGECRNDPLYVGDLTVSWSFQAE